MPESSEGEPGEIEGGAVETDEPDPTEVEIQIDMATENDIETGADAQVEADGNGVALGGEADGVDRVIFALLHGDTAARHALIEFTEFACTHATGLGGPPKCEADEAEGTPVHALPVLGPSGVYFTADQLADLHLNPASIYAVYRFEGDSPDPSWPPGDYGIILLDADELAHAITAFVTDGKIVRLTYHFGSPPEQILLEAPGEILYTAQPFFN